MRLSAASLSAPKHRKVHSCTSAHRHGPTVGGGPPPRSQSRSSGCIGGGHLGLGVSIGLGEREYRSRRELQNSKSKSDPRFLPPSVWGVPGAAAGVSAFIVSIQIIDHRSVK